VNISGLSEQLVAWFKHQGADLLHAGKTEARPAGTFQAGEQYLGKVQDTLPNGRSLVQVGQTRLDMALPKDVRVGDTVRLIYVASGPRPTFQLAQEAIAPPQAVRLSDTAQQVNALLRFAQATGNTPPAAATGGAPTAARSGTPAGMPATAANSANPASTGNIGIQGVLQGTGLAGQARPIVSNVAVFFAPTGGAPPTTSAMTGGAANPAMMPFGQEVDGARPALSSHASLMTQGIATEDPARNAVLPMRLRQILSESGMFYESHLGRWTQGGMTLDSILREPQARLAEHPGAVLKLPELQGMPEEAARLAGRQLHMAEGGAFVWQGYAWPGQWLDWRVDEDAADSQADPEAARWRTQLRLELPRLGAVAADLGIGPRGLNIKIAAGGATTLEEIRAALPELLERLSLADLRLASVQLSGPDGDA
jgi:hypothetical protein